MTTTAATLGAARYIIRTTTGDKGPFTAAQIHGFVAAGKLPATARIHDSLTGAPLPAGEVRAEAAPATTGKSSSAIWVSPPGDRAQEVATTRVIARPAKPAPAAAPAAPAPARPRRTTRGASEAIDPETGEPVLRPTRRRKRTAWLPIVLTLSCMLILGGITGIFLYYNAPVTDVRVHMIGSWQIDVDRTTADQILLLPPSQRDDVRRKVQEQLGGMVVVIQEDRILINMTMGGLVELVGSATAGVQASASVAASASAAATIPVAAMSYTVTKIEGNILYLETIENAKKSETKLQVFRNAVTFSQPGKMLYLVRKQ